MSSSIPSVLASAVNSRNAQTLPTAFKCRVGGEWKPSDCFSKNQLAKWHQARRSRNSSTTAANIGLTCREHSGEPNLGLHCNGPCGLWKSREQFSANQRRNNLRWCLACIRWQAEQNYDSIPQAAPNEVNEDTHEHEGVTDLAGGIGFDDDDEDYSDDEVITSASLTNRPDDGGDYNGSDNDDDHYHEGNDDEEDDNPTASVFGHGHYFDHNEEDDESSDDDITVSNVDPARNLSQGSAVGTTHAQQATADRPSSHAAPLALTGSQVSGPAFSSSFGPYSHAGHNLAGDWLPEHLRENGNLNTLRTSNLVEHHVPSYGHDTLLGSQMSTSSQTEIGMPRNTTSSVHHGASASFLSSAASSDSRAGRATTSNGSQAGSNENRRSPGAQSYNAYDAQGNVHRRVARPGNSTAAGSSRVSNQNSLTLRAPRGNGSFARVEQRKNFEAIQLPKAQTGANHIAVYDSGSEDEF